MRPEADEHERADEQADAPERGFDRDRCAGIGRSPRALVPHLPLRIPLPARRSRGSRLSARSGDRGFPWTPSRMPAEIRRGDSSEIRRRSRRACRRARRSHGRVPRWARARARRRRRPRRSPARRLRRPRRSRSPPPGRGRPGLLHRGVAARRAAPARVGPRASARCSSRPAQYDALPATFWRRRLAAPVYVASDAVLRRVVGFDLHRGAVAAADRWPLPAVDDVLRGRAPRRGARTGERPREPRRAVPQRGRARCRRGAARPGVLRSAVPPLRARVDRARAAHPVDADRVGRRGAPAPGSRPSRSRPAPDATPIDAGRLARPRRAAVRRGGPGPLRRVAARRPTSASASRCSPAPTRSTSRPRPRSRSTPPRRDRRRVESSRGSVDRDPAVRRPRCGASARSRRAAPGRG